MAPVAKLARPWVFGPINRIPFARAASPMRVSSACPAGPVSPKPAAMTTATATPASALSSTARTAASPGTITITASGRAGSAARLG